ncbi:MAG: hypothetical protein QNJ38_12615 [Prochloraceae cyanobacterium]|nr:hypothetical protein [Prochloraceae cyanobacterium]
MSDLKWTETEQKIASEALQKAYEREMDSLIKEVRHQASSLEKLDDIWHLHDFLSARRHEIDGKYDFRDSVLIFVFARLVKEGWLDLDRLDGLDRDKITKISALARM